MCFSSEKNKKYKKYKKNKKKVLTKTNNSDRMNFADAGKELKKP